uniref:DUF11 domain-containing protein n=1 Tax=Acetithermum autotrophicum TaxID=1446466 RepID=H5SV58_ACEAU|nr:hypothetical protein HGMM_OP4C123 [Candidatus Acetothermum autotrophicum]
MKRRGYTLFLLGALGLLLSLGSIPAVTLQVTNCVQPPSGMTAWWPLDETSGTTVTDIVNGFNGTTQPGPISGFGGPGPTPILPSSFPPGMVGSSLFFGAGRHIRVPHNPNLDPGTGSFAVDFWFIWGGGSGPIIQKMLPTGEGWGIFVVPSSTNPNNATVQVKWTFASGFSMPVATLAIVANRWYFLYAHIERGFGTNPDLSRLFLFDPLAGTMSNTGPGVIAGVIAPTNTISTTADLLIGGDGVTPGARIAVDEVEIFKRALTLQEIQAIYNAGAAGKCKQPPEPTADLGDAPDSTNHPNKPMTAYTSVPAKFPTVFDPATGTPPGPKHLAPKKLAWLGKDVSFENEADLLPDADTVTNIDPSTNAADQDKFDDGVVLPIAIPMVCGQTQFNYTVTSTTAAKLYVNVWFDFNRDGDWNDPIQKCPLGPAVTGSFTEWAVQNQLITVSGPGTFTFTTPFGAANPTKGQDMWMRITLTDQPIAPAQGADGSGPAGGYQFGETEDYLLRLEYTELCGIKWNDLNGNGKQDPGEPGLANWVIEVKDANGNIIGYAVTDDQGRYCVVVPSPGKYTVTEQQQQGWTQTAPPAPGTYTVTVPPAQTNLNFGNQQKEGKAEICVFKFNDLNGNGKQDPNEPLLPGWSFTVSPTPLPPTTSPVTTGLQGGICFGVAAPGTYTITEIVQPGWTPTTPNPQTVTVAPGQLANVFFGNQKEEKPCDLAIKKTATPTPTALVQVTITLTVPAGQTCTPGTVVVGDQQPPGMNFNLPGALVVTPAADWNCSATTSSNLSCTNAVTLAGSYTATFTFTSTVQPGINIENCATATVSGQLISKSCVPVQVAPPGVCDRQIKKSVSPNPVPSGGTVTITLTVTNVGTAPCPVVAGINVADPQPAGMTFNTAVPPTANKPGWSCGFTPPGPTAFCISSSPLLPGSTNAVTITFTAKVTAPPGSQIQNCAEVTNVGDANQANNKSCVTITVIGIPPPPVDLTLAKLFDGVLRPEAEVTYALRVMNVGGAPTSSAIRVSDPLPPTLRFVAAAGLGWNCSAQGQNVVCTSAGPIAPNQISTILLRVRVAAQPGQQITNCATVETAGDANPANNRGCHTGTVQR